MFETESLTSDKGRAWQSVIDDESMRLAVLIRCAPPNFMSTLALSRGLRVSPWGLRHTVADTPVRFRARKLVSWSKPCLRWFPAISRPAQWLITVRFEVPCNGAPLPVNEGLLHKVKGVQVLILRVQPRLRNSTVECSIVCREVAGSIPVVTAIITHDALIPDKGVWGVMAFR